MGRFRFASVVVAVTIPHPHYVCTTDARCQHVFAFARLQQVTIRHVTMIYKVSLFFFLGAGLGPKHHRLPVYTIQGPTCADSFEDL